MRFLPDERGQSIQIGAVLLFAVLIILLALWQAIVVPNQNEEVEFNHNEDLQQQMTELRSTVNSMPDAQTTRSVTLDLGVRYPSRSIFRNPPPVRGSLRTVGGPNGELRATIDNASAVDMEGETGDFWNGSSRAYGTRSIQYQPAYNEYSNAPRTIYEHSVLFNKFDTEQQDLAVTGQTLVRGERLTLIAVNGSLSESRVDSASVDFVPLSTETESVEVRPDGGPITLELPTRLSQGEWRTLFETVETVDTNNVTVNASAFPDNDDLGLLQVTLEQTDSAGDTRTYTLRLAKIGLGTGTTTTEPAYVTDVAGNNSTIQTGETQALTVEARDKFNRPLSGITVSASAEGGSFANDADTTTTTTGTDGMATLQYTGVATGTNDINVTIDEGYQPLPGGSHAVSSPTNLTASVTIEQPEQSTEDLVEGPKVTALSDNDTLQAGENYTLAGRASSIGNGVVRSGTPIQSITWTTQGPSGGTDRSGVVEEFDPDISQLNQTASTVVNTTGWATGDHVFNLTGKDATGRTTEIRGPTVTIETPPANSSFFDVQITSAPENVTAGDTATVEATVENIGGGSGTQDIVFDVDGQQEGVATGVSLDPGQSRDLTFSYTTDSTDSPDVTAAVTSDNDTESSSIAIFAQLSVKDFTIENVRDDETFTVAVTVNETANVQTDNLQIALDVTHPVESPSYSGTISRTLEGNDTTVVFGEDDATAEVGPFPYPNGEDPYEVTVVADASNAAPATANANFRVVTQNLALNVENDAAGVETVHNWTFDNVDIGNNANDEEVDPILLDYSGTGVSFDDLTDADIEVVFTRELASGTDRKVINVNSDTYSGEQATIDLDGGEETSIVGSGYVRIDGLQNPPTAGNYSANITFQNEGNVDGQPKSVTAEQSFSTAATTQGPALASKIIDQGQTASRARYELSYNISNRAQFDRVEVSYDNLDSGGADQTYTRTDPRTNVDDYGWADTFGGTGGDTYEITIEVFDTSGTVVDARTVTDDADGTDPAGNADLSEANSPQLSNRAIQDESQFSNAQYDINYTVSDPAGRFTETEVLFYNRDTATATGQETGTQLSEVLSYSAGGAEGDTYDIIVQVQDDDGIVVDSETITDVADGAGFTQPGIVFAGKSNGRLSTIDSEGRIARSVYDVTGTTATGPQTTDFAFGSGPEVPYKDGNGNLGIVDLNGNKRVLVDTNYSPGINDARLAVGQVFVGNGNSLQTNGGPFVYFINGNGLLTRVDSGGTVNVVSVDGTQVSAQSVAGTGDIDGDGSPELIYIDSNGQFEYVDSQEAGNSGNFKATIVSLSGSPTLNTPNAVGAPADIDSDGAAEIPYINGNKEVSYVNGPDGTDPAGSTTVLTTGAGGEYPVGVADVAGDASLEVVYVDTSGNQRLAYAGTGGISGFITDFTDNDVPAKTNTGAS